MQSKPCYHSQLDLLRSEISKLEGTSRSLEAKSVPTGCLALDKTLPQRGFRAGTLVEWLTSGDGTGAVTLALLAAKNACRGGGVLVVLDCQREFYPPAAVPLGIELPHLIVVQPANPADHHWALDQSLRCPAVGAVLAWPEKLDSRTFRRLQLAAEEGGSLGLLVRPAEVRKEPSWADVRLLVEPLPAASPPARKRRLRIVLLRCRGGIGNRELETEIDV
jgi:hypothetical protein